MTAIVSKNLFFRNNLLFLLPASRNHVFAIHRWEILMWRDIRIFVRLFRLFRTSFLVIIDTVATKFRGVSKKRYPTLYILDISNLLHAHSTYEDSHLDISAELSSHVLSCLKKQLFFV